MGALSVLVAQLFWAVAALMLKKVIATVNPLSIIVVVELCTMLILVPFFVLQYREIALLDRQEMIWLITRAVMIVIGNLLFMYGVAKLPLSQASLLTMTFPLFAILLAILFLGEPITLKFIVAALFFAAGYALLTF